MKKFEDFKIWFENKLKELNLFPDLNFIELMFQTCFEGLQPDTNPKIIVLGGGPGSGKTTFRKKHLHKGSNNNYYIHDMDETLVLLPGYQEMFQREGTVRAFEAWWPIAQQVIDILMVYATQNKLNIIYDHTCGSEGSYLSLKNAREQGYRIVLYGFYVEEEKLLQRVLERSIDEGRLVSKEIVSEYLRRFSTLWLCYLKIVDQATLYNNNGLEYKEIFSVQNGKPNVFNYGDYRNFLSMGYDIKIAMTKFPNIPALLDEIKLQEYQKRKAQLGLFYSTSSIIQFHLEIEELSKNPRWLAQAALWTEEKWGYIRGFPGVSKREELLKKISNGFYMVTYGKCAVGMFALFDHDTLPHAKELMYVYVDEPFRGLGIGKKIITMAKQISASLSGKIIIFDTLNPNLNRFYEKQGAEAVCDGQLLGHPTTVFKM
jgi:diamine N-acetyltransferase